MVGSTRRRPKYATFYLCDGAASKVLLARPRSAVVARKPGLTLWLVRDDEPDPVTGLPPTGVSRFVTRNKAGSPLESTDHPLFGARVGQPWDVETVVKVLKLNCVGVRDEG